MPMQVTNALAAYAKAAAKINAPGTEARTSVGSSFGDLVRQAAESAVDASRKGEEMSAKAIAGTADLADVVTAVTSAEVTLQTVVAIRDKVIAAYNDISKMPI